MNERFACHEGVDVQRNQALLNSRGFRREFAYQAVIPRLNLNFRYASHELSQLLLLENRVPVLILCAPYYLLVPYSQGRS